MPEPRPGRGLSGKDRLENLDMKLPKPTVDLADIKRRYLAALAEEKAARDG